MVSTLKIQFEYQFSLVADILQARKLGLVDQATLSTPANTRSEDALLEQLEGLKLAGRLRPIKLVASVESPSVISLLVQRVVNLGTRCWSARRPVRKAKVSLATAG